MPCHNGGGRNPPMAGGAPLRFLSKPLARPRDGPLFPIVAAAAPLAAPPSLLRAAVSRHRTPPHRAHDRSRATHLKSDRARASDFFEKG